MPRFVIWTALAVVSLVTLLPLALMAQPMPAASAASEPTRAITYNSPCGAAGYGKQWSPADGKAKDEPHAREGVPGKHVDAKGYWSTCTMPAPPKDCAERKAPAWLVNGRLCQPVPGRMIPARDAPFGHDVGTAPGLRNQGLQHWRCERWADGKTEWRSVGATCKPRQP